MCRQSFLSPRFTRNTLMILFLLGGSFFLHATRLQAQTAEATAQPLRVKEFHPTSGERIEGEITVLFDAPVAPCVTPDDDSTFPLLFKPALAGEFRFNPTGISFKPSSFPFEQVYEVRVNPLLHSLDNRPLAADTPVQKYRTFDFPTRVWLSRMTEDTAWIGFRFGVPVLPEDLNRYLSVSKPTVRNTDPNKPLPPETASSSETLPSVTIEPSRNPNILFAKVKNCPHYANIHIAPGLQDAQKQFTVRETKVDTIILINRFEANSNIGIEEVKPEGPDVQFRMSLPNFSAEADNVASLMQLTDLTTTSSQKTVPFKLISSKPDATTGKKNSFLVQFHTSDLQNLDFQVELPKGFCTSNGALSKPIQKRFTRRVELKFQSASWGPVQSDNENVTKMGLVLQFNEPIRKEEFEKGLCIEPATENLVVRTPNYQGATTYLEFALEGDWEAETSYTLTLPAGLPFGEKAALREPLVQVVQADSRLAPQITQCEFPPYVWEEASYLHLTLNQRTTPKSLQEHLTVEPPVGNIQIAVERQNQYKIRGDWEPKKEYKITLTPGLTFQRNRTLKNPLTATATSPEKLRGTVRFDQPGKLYFPHGDEAALNVESQNITTVTLRIHQVFPNNLIHAVRSINNAQGSWWSNLEAANSFSELLESRELDYSAHPYRLNKTRFLLKDLIPNNKLGLFVVEAKVPSDQQYAQAILRTNIGALAHWQGEELILFAHDLYSLAPLPGAKVTVYSDKYQMMGEGVTGEDGIAHLTKFNKKLGTPATATVEGENDATFLKLDPRQEGKLPYEAGAPAYDATQYDGYLYADRQLYRPGDTVHLRWIVRQNYGDAVPGVPLKIQVLKPDGKTLIDEPTQLSPWGGGTLDVQTLQSHPTGKYIAQVLVPGANKVIAYYEFQVEEFVPNRIKVSAELPEKTWVAGKAQEVRLQALHLFGKPAEKRHATGRVVFDRAYKSERWPDYIFGNDTKYNPNPVPLSEADTSSSGTATLQFDYKMPPQVTFPMVATARVQVHELGGRAVNASAQAGIFPSDLTLGLRVNRSEGPDGGMDVHLLAMTPAQEPAQLGEVEVVLEKQVWNYYIRRYYSHYDPNFEREYEEIEVRKVPLVNGQAVTTLKPEDYGYYRVTVRSPRTPQFANVSFYSYGGHCEMAKAPDASLINVVLDTKQYQPGQTAQIRVESPFDGKALIVIQGASIRRMIPLDIVQGVGTTSYLVQEDDYPNVWVEATVVHAIEKNHSQIYPFSSFAMANLKVLAPERELKVSLPNLPVEVRPLGKRALDLLVTDSQGRPVASEVTLAAVDEGIHSIKGYVNPDPVNYFSRSRRPDFRRAHYYDQVAYDFTEPAPGGDQDALAPSSKYLGRADTNWIKAVALWSGVVQTSATGQAHIEFDVPEFNGQLRLVAVASNEKAAGSTAGSIFVRRPYILQTNMPRFFLPSDRANCRAVLYNNTSETCHARVTWTASGTLTETNGSIEFDIAPNGEGNVLTEFSARAAIGQGQIAWHVEITDAKGAALETFDENAPVPVCEPTGFQSFQELHVLNPGETQTYRNTRFLDNDLTELEISASPDLSLRLQKALRYVVGYPYGCVEQTTSKLFPLYLLRKNQILFQAALDNPQQVDAYIQAGIDRLFSMQTASGGLGYWPGSTESNSYGSVYAFHALVTIKNGREKFFLPDQGFQALQKHVRAIAQTSVQNPYLGDHYLRAYAAYTLALAGDKDALSLIQRFDAVSIPRSSRFLLAAGLARLTQDPARVQEYLKKAPSVPYTERETDGTLNSEIRGTAVELVALAQMNGTLEEMAPLAKTLTDAIAGNRYYTTQENAFIIAALCDYFNRLPGESARATITGSNGETKTIEEKTQQKVRHKGPNGAFTVKNEGPGVLQVNVVTRGIPEKGATEAKSEGMSIRRHLTKRDGSPLDSETFKQGESYVVEVEIYCKNEYKNVVVSDLLPAGFEVENPRLNAGGEAGSNFPHKAVTPSFLEIRDERVVLAFNSLEASQQDAPEYTHHYYYVVNAVTPGAFQYPPIQAECMYDATVRANSVGSAITIK
jgi:uncharacterized protein YfaS (alpha-2-macroglobulin family)